MGSFSCQINSRGIDTSVGGLLWVRRRNGSWWPGQVVGLNELPLEILDSSRVGTPVKLIGKDNARIDWYNLEKSKRVKAFHCLEYDEWTKQAKAYTTHTSKKRVTYARRENAILHALKLEDEHKKECGICSRGHRSTYERSNTFESETSDIPSKGFEAAFQESSSQEVSQPVISSERPYETSTSKLGVLPKAWLKNSNSMKNKVNERREYTSVLQEESIMVPKRSARIFMLNSASHRNFSGVNSVARCLSSCILKRDQFQIPQFCETIRKKTRCQPLVKVLENAVEMEVSSVSCGDLRIMHPSLQRVIYRTFDDFSCESKRNQSQAIIGSNFAETSQGTLDKGETQIQGFINDQTRNDGKNQCSVAYKSNSFRYEGLLKENPSHWSKHRASRRSTISNCSRVPPSSRSLDQGLYDAEIEVLASYQGNHVPLVSLMSKFNGNCIVGHPIRVEALDDCKLLNELVESCLINNAAEMKGIGKKISKDLRICTINSLVPLYGSNHATKSPAKFKDRLVSKKTRKLSSIACDHKPSEMNRRLVAVDHKPSEMNRRSVVESLTVPDISCVPLKLVFSRINESLNHLKLEKNLHMKSV